MALISWNESYGVKVAELDGHHQKLFALINTLHDAMSHGQGRTILQQVIAELSDYVDFHFKAEEALLERAKYPGLPGHRVEHRRFTAKVAGFRKDLDAGANGNAVAVLEFLTQWLSEHIKKWIGVIQHL